MAFSPVCVKMAKEHTTLFKPSRSETLRSMFRSVVGMVPLTTRGPRTVGAC